VGVIPANSSGPRRGTALAQRPEETLMKLETEFYKLPVTFDSNRVYEEISRIEPYRWVPRGNPRYLSLPLVSHHGLDTQHPSPPTWPTDNLERCPYLRQVLAHFRSALTDVRVRRVEPNTSASEHYDEHYAGFTRYRLHLPLLTDPRIVFRCNGRDVHMERGEVWLFDRMALYGIHNPTQWPRVHISIETSGSSTLWNLIERAERPFAPSSAAIEAERIDFRQGWEASVLTENTPGPAVLPPGDLDCFLADLLDRVRTSRLRDTKRYREVVSAVRRFQHDWRTLWSLMGSECESWPRYRTLAETVLREVADLDRDAGGLSELKPGLTGRLHDFLRTGALNPRMSPYQIDGEATPDRIYEMIGEPLMRLRVDGSFEVWNALHKQYRPIQAEDIDLLRWFSKPTTVAAAADGAGYACDSDLLQRVNYFMLQHLVRPLRAMPGVAPPDFELPPRAPTSPNEDDAMAPATSPGSVERFPVRLQEDVYFRLRAGSRDTFIWVPKLHAYRALNWYWLRLVAALATGLSAWEAADVAGLRYDDQVEAAIAMLLHHGVLTDTQPAALPRRARAGR
jgi:hypothetical protein